MARKRVLARKSRSLDRFGSSGGFDPSGGVGSGPLGGGTTGGGAGADGLPRRSLGRGRRSLGRARLSRWSNRARRPSFSPSLLLPAPLEASSPPEPPG